ncbi:MAG: chemotaxis response regulator protein-glutamate methylesterase, partial [Paraglaciecola polaris]|uniref:protein-glutamate methylesterase/protein-glutamine glutaminase n=1 Tax=Paraglaciecola polaris TaxID=222814 RepID=UPI0030026E89
MAIRVLIVDDSALIRSLIGAIVNQQPDMLLVGAAPDAYVARDMVNKFAPDVITLDIEMPKVDGLNFLEKLMKARPTPVLMISTLTEHGADATLRALELGAVDFIAKPKLGISEGIQRYQKVIVDKIRLVAMAKVKRVQPSSVSPPTQLPLLSTEKIIAIGASIGGTEAIKKVLMAMPANSPAIVITQHMPPGFTTSFAKRLNDCCKVAVKEAMHDERILPGTAYLAPGAMHLKIVKSGADYRTKLEPDGIVSGHKPSVDVMFESLVPFANNVVAAILTGMGKDGAQGLRNIKHNGGFTVAQDEASCVVFGMPKVAIEQDAVMEVKDIHDI